MSLVPKFISWLITLPVLLSPFGLSAQIKVSRYVAQSSHEQGYVSVRVADSASHSFLDGAAVFMSDGCDTVKVAAEFGLCDVPRPFTRDSVTISCHLLGYKTLTEKIELKKGWGYSITAYLQEDPLQLNSIVVQGDAVAMVIHGDTTIFNASAFSNQKGDQLRDLLKKFPGVEISNGSVSYQGQKIDRILFNGNNLFGKQMGDAMDMVLADEVKSVKVYEKQSIENDYENEAKERVMDVHTKKPLTHVGQISLAGNGGAYTSRKPEGGINWFAGGAASIGSYTLGSRPRIGASLSGGHNSNGNYCHESPLEMINGSIFIGKDTPAKGGWTHLINLSSNTTKAESGNNTDYIDALQWSSRRDSTSEHSKDSNRAIAYSGNGYLNKGKNRFSLTGRLNIGHDVTSNRKYSESVIEGNRSYFDRHRGDTTNSFAAHLSLSYQRRFDKRGRRLKLSSSFDGSYGKGHGARIDTAGRGFSPSFLSNTATTGYFTPSMSFSWEEPLGKKHSLLFSISGKYNYSTQERLFLDILTGKPDCINTRFFTENRLNGTISATYAYGRENDGFSSRITLGVNDNLCMRNERLGDIPSANPNFIRPDVGLRIGYAAKGKSVLLTYSESESVPTTQQLRESLDDSNPMFLTAGNGNLKLPVNRTLAL